MNEYAVNSADLKTVAEAIRAKGETTESLTFPDGFAEAIANIKAGEDVEQATPTIAVDSDGLITASATQAAGLVPAGTKSATKQLTVQAAQTITPGTSNKTIASGRYLTGTQTIKGDANLQAANIKKGVSIFGVTGIYEKPTLSFDGDFFNESLCDYYPVTQYLNPTTCTATVSNSNIVVTTKAGVASHACYVFGPVDLSYYNSLHASGTYTGNGGGNVISALYVAKNATTMYSAAVACARDLADSKATTFTRTLDVSGLSGSYYIYVGTDTNGGGWANQRIVSFDKVWGVMS